MTLWSCAMCAVVYRMGEVEVEALHVDELSIRRGEFVAIVGPSGSGKTTLLNLIGGIDAPTSGSISFDGQDISHFSRRELTLFRRENIGFVFQFFNLIPTLTAEENVRFALELAERDGQGPDLKPADLLAKVGLAERTRHFPAQLSGGEQRAWP
jgi:putative ABC transport system ATP-binding protein